MNVILFNGATLGFLALCMGTYLDHVLKISLDQRAQHIMQTALHYHQWHALLIVVLGLCFYAPLTKKLRIHLAMSAWLITFGVLLFSFSLYLSVMTGLTWMTSFAPVGGVTLMLGWVSLMWLSLKPLQHKVI